MAREVALEILLKYHNEHSYLHITLNEYLKDQENFKNKKQIKTKEKLDD